AVISVSFPPFSLIACACPQSGYFLAKAQPELRISAQNPPMDILFMIATCGLRHSARRQDQKRLFGKEGLFFATLRGPGRVWLQSLPLSRLAWRIMAASPRPAVAAGKK